MTEHDLTSVPVTGLRAELNGLANRLRWLRARLMVPALRRAPFIRLGRHGQWLVSGGRLVIGPGAVLGANHYLYLQGQLHIGRDFYANRDFYLSCMDQISIGDRVRLGERVSLHDENHVFEPVDDRLPARRFGYSVKPIRIGDDVWLGANVVVLPGAVIGSNTVVAANSVVRGSLPPNVLAGGQPAVVIRELTR